jgi:hypothetical protein
LAKFLLETREDVINALIAVERGEIRSVRFGSDPLADPSVFRTFCSMHKELLPTCSIRPTHAETALLAEEVIAGIVDAAIVTLPLKPDAHERLLGLLDDAGIKIEEYSRASNPDSGSPHREQFETHATHQNLFGAAMAPGCSIFP